MVFTSRPSSRTSEIAASRSERLGLGHRQEHLVDRARLRQPRQSLGRVDGNPGDHLALQRRVGVDEGDQAIRADARTDAARLIPLLLAP